MEEVMKKNKESCPVCSSDSLIELNNHVYEFKHGRKTHTVSGLSHSLCQECGVSMFFPEQMDINNALVKDFQKNLKDYISPEQVLELREIYNITQGQANIIFGGGPTAFSKYERGVSSPSAGAARNMLSALNDHVHMAQMCAQQGVKLQVNNVVNASIDSFLEKLAPPLLLRVQNYALESSLSVWEACMVLVAKGLDAEDAETENLRDVHVTTTGRARNHIEEVSGYRVESSRRHAGLNMSGNFHLYEVIKTTKAIPAVVRVARRA